MRLKNSPILLSYKHSYCIGCFLDIIGTSSWNFSARFLTLSLPSVTSQLCKINLTSILLGFSQILILAASIWQHRLVEGQVQLSDGKSLTACALFPVPSTVNTLCLGLWLIFPLSRMDLEYDNTIHILSITIDCIITETSNFIVIIMTSISQIYYEEPISVQLFLQ